ncbi:MAG TPA: PAS domain S-box protein [Leptospiraceae bacterium]|nr:PAS domain S-box protein [Leptospiraceae bacterium]HMW06875.1 PAS domain S-box protein [Leptospiraceae bacterium]HMX34567.1 PAS domain S-box protein [Leptospiraceae bacterium]HMY32394.1 PAS domain S-box protein [Leptospiraceae bacterium]HMZ65310.1 PAS domain S-box protein [Leptospiraceae bacterium]
MEGFLDNLSIENADKKLRTIIEYSPQAIVIYDLNLGHFIDANHNAEILFGYDRSELLKLNPIDLSPPEQPNGESSKALKIKKIRETLENGITNFEWIHKDRQNNIIHCEVYLTKLPDTSHNIILGSIVDITEKVKSREKLKENEEMLRLALGAAKLGIWIWNISNNVITWSDGVYEIFDVSPSEFHGTITEYENLIYKEDRKNVFNSIRWTLTNSVTYSIEHRILTKNNKIKWLEGKGSVERDSNGNPVRMLGSVVDITERKLTEEYLRASEERLSFFYKFTNEAIIILDGNKLRIIDSNPKFRQLFLYDDGEFINLEASSLMIRESWQRIEYSFHKEIEQFESEILARKKSNIIFPALLRVHSFEDRGHKNYILTIIDISTAKEAEQLKKINKEILLQNEKIENQKLELENAILNLKQTQAKLIQSEKLASLGQLITGIAHEINNPIGAILASSQNLEDCLEESRRLFPSIIQIFNTMDKESIEEFSNLILESIGKKSFLIGLDRRKKRQEMFTMLQNLNLPTELDDMIVDLGVVSLNQYRNILKNPHIQLLLKFALQEVFANRNISTIQMSVDRSSKVIYALKNFTHFETDAKKKLNQVSDTIETVLTIYQNHLKKIEIIKSYKYNEAIYCYPDDLIHLWTNIIYNALQAMKFQGILKIEIQKQNDFIEISITDSGEGIPIEIKDKIFEPFFTTKPPGEGSGLGLDIAKKIVDKHMGKIDVKSEKGSTTFTVLLPIFLI